MSCDRLRRASGRCPRRGAATLAPTPNALFLPLPVRKAFELHVEREVAVPEIVAEQSRRSGSVDEQQIFVAIVIDVGNRDRGRPGRAHGTGISVERSTKSSRAVVPKEKHARRPLLRAMSAHQKVEPPIIVVIHERRGRSRRIARACKASSSGGRE